MDDDALLLPSPRPGRPTGLPRPRRRAARAGAVALLAAALTWPGAGAHALPAPAAPAAVLTQAVDPAPTGALSGRVTDGSGAPVEGVRVVVLSSGNPIIETATDGTWRAEGLEEGPHVVRFVRTAPDGVRSSLYWDGSPYGTHAFTFLPPLAAGEDRGGLDVAFVDNATSGTVTAGGEPVAGATVGFYRRASDRNPATTVTTAADGTWTARWLRPDSYAVKVTPPEGSGLAPGWWNRTGDSVGTLPLEGATPRTLTGIDVELAAEARLTGRVVDEAGQPVAGVRVAAWADRARPAVAGYATTGTDGTYTFGGLDAASYTVQVAPQRGAADAAWTVESFLGGALTAGAAVWTPVAAQEDVAVADLVLRLGGTISGEVVGAPGWDGPGISVEVLAADGSVVATVPALENADAADFATPVLPAGVYRVRAAMPGDGHWWLGGTSAGTARAVEVGPRAAVAVELELSDEFAGVPPAPTEALTDANRGGLSVAGPVVAGDEATLVGLGDGGLGYVWLAPSLQGLGYGRAAADGTLQVVVPAGTAAGAYRLVVTTPGGFVLGWADLTVTAAAAPAPGAVPGAPAPAATPATTTTPAAAVRDARTGADGRRSGALAATGADVAWLVGGAAAALLLGAGLVVLRRRRSA
ncbi:collagen binding domain-containing protein [Cellulomonas sp. NPDC057328]|uniref:MSCRAMM family protein n=1 Tax=Cellulomonas sp. NPDC057328 TaxID=3346101 RepID=UPI0036325678